MIYALIFLSTPSARRATVIAFSYAILQEFLSTPSARRATKGNGHGLLPERFLSTPSARRATWHQYGASVHQSISIHALREEGDARFRRLHTEVPISIHALREEGDEAVCFPTDHSVISIHALREEGDISIPAALPQGRYFYPRPPRGGRLAASQVHTFAW